MYVPNGALLVANSAAGKKCISCSVYILLYSVHSACIQICNYKKHANTVCNRGCFVRDTELRNQSALVQNLHLVEVYARPCLFLGFLPSYSLLFLLQ